MPPLTFEPRLKASHCHATLRTLEAKAPGAVARVLERLPAEVRQGLAVTTVVDLVPARWDVLLVTAIDAVLGGPATKALARDTMLDSLRGSLLGTFLETSLKLWGPSPEKLLGWAGRVYGHVTLRCGTLRLETADRSTARLVLDGMPPGLAVPQYLDAIAGTLESIFVVCEVEGQVLAAHRPDGAVFEASWAALPGKERAR